MQYWWLFTVWGNCSSLYSFIERHGNQLVLFCSEPMLFNVEVNLCHFSSWCSEHVLMVKLMSWCIFSIGVASAPILCTGHIRAVIIVFPAMTLELRRQFYHNTRLREVQTVIELDFDESEALCFLSCFRFYNPSVIHPGTPAPRTPPSLTRRGGGVFCLSTESQRVCNNKPSIIPSTRGRRAGFKCLTHSQTLHIVLLLCDDQPLSWMMFPCQLKKMRFFYSWHTPSALFLTPHHHQHRVF